MKIDGIQTGAGVAASALSNRQGSHDIKLSPSGQPENMPLPERQYSEEQVNKAVEKANKSFESFDRRFEISVHDKIKNAIMIKVIDSRSEEVIREIPSQKLLDMVANMLEVAGILMDKKG